MATTAVFAGAGWAASTQEPTPPAPSPGSGSAAPASDQPVPTRTAAQWAIDAEQTLAAVNSQLDLIAHTEEIWNRQPASLRTGPPPPPLQEMRGRRAVLSQQKALLQLQLDTYRTLDVADRELRDAEQKVAMAERAMPADPSMANSPDGRRLAEQREVLERRRDAEREQRDSLGAAVQKTVASPLPDRADHRTKSITESVIGLVSDPLRRRAPAEPDKQQPTVTPPRDVPTRPRKDVDKVAPPRPGPQPSVGLGEPAAPEGARRTRATDGTSRAAAPGTADQVDTGSPDTGSPDTRSRDTRSPAPDGAGRARYTADGTQTQTPTTGPPDRQPAMSMLDSSRGLDPQRPSYGTRPSPVPRATSNTRDEWRPSPRPREITIEWDRSRLGSSGGSPSGSSPTPFASRRGTTWSASDARAQFRDGPRGGDRRGSRGGGSSPFRR